MSSQDHPAPRPSASPPPDSARSSAGKTKTSVGKKATAGKSPNAAAKPRDAAPRKRSKPNDPIPMLVDQAQRKTCFRMELMSVICEALKHSDTAKQMKAWISKHYPRYGRHLTREDCWRLIRRAARKGWLRFDPPSEHTMQMALEERYNWAPGRLNVVHTAVLDQVARRAAEKLLEMVRECRDEQGLDTIRIGFAGGRSLRKVAEHLARLLATGSEKNPKKIVFHAMVSAFGVSDYAADPNSFITYFVQEPLDVEIAFAPMPAPGLVESARRDELKRFQAIEQAFAAAHELNIIVTSGGRLDDEHSTLSAYVGQLGTPDQRTFIREQLRERQVLGDLLWQPIAADGPFNMQTNGFDFCPNALVDLEQLPAFIDHGMRVLLVLGACGACGEPKGALLDAILGAPLPLVTDVVTDSPNVFELFEVTRDRYRSGIETRKPR